MELELSQWGDESVRLSFEDYLHGEDRTFVLNADGTAARAEYQDDGSEILMPVNLVEALRELLEWKQARDKGDLS